MVNTFLTHACFRESARNLDRARLIKQRLESYQILNIISDIEFLCNYYDIAIPETANLKVTVNHLRKLMKQEDWRFVQLKNLARAPTKKDLEIMVIYPVNEVDYVQVPLELTQQINTSTSCIRAVNLGFANHPAVSLWWGYPLALKAYLNAFMDEIEERGYKNNMGRYEVPDQYPRPSWTDDPEFHRIHRSALLDKEITRKEKPWYQLKEEFVQAGPFTGYRWY